MPVWPLHKGTCQYALVPAEQTDLPVRILPLCFVVWYQRHMLHTGMTNARISKETRKLFIVLTIDEPYVGDVDPPVLASPSKQK